MRYYHSNHVIYRPQNYEFVPVFPKFRMPTIYMVEYLEPLSEIQNIIIDDILNALRPTYIEYFEYIPRILIKWIQPLDDNICNGMILLIDEDHIRLAYHEATLTYDEYTTEKLLELINP